MLVDILGTQDFFTQNYYECIDFLLDISKNAAVC